MKLRESKFSFFEEMCIEKFGKKDGNKIIRSSNEILNSLLSTVDDRGNAAIRKHLEQNMLPTAAYYKALLLFGYSPQKAYELTLDMTQKAAVENSKKNEKLGNMKAGFFLFKMAFRTVMKKNFPDEGWQKEWVTYSNHEISVNMKSCIYYDVTKQLGCPELCTVFCKNDTTAFKGYQPAILFERGGTIGEGDTVCDFHFYNGKLHK